MVFSSRPIKDITYCFLLVYHLLGRFQPYIGCPSHLPINIGCLPAIVVDFLAWFLNKSCVYLITAVTQHKIKYSRTQESFASVPKVMDEQKRMS